MDERKGKKSLKTYPESGFQEYKHTDFRTRVQRFLSITGLSLPDLATRHGELLNSKDDATSLRAVQLGYQLHGMNDDQQAQNSGDVNIQINIVPVVSKDSAPKNLSNEGAGV
jgi:hypothetical protein